SSTTLQESTTTLSNDNQDYQYMLTRLLQKIQRFVTQNPISAITFYTSFNEVFVSEIEKETQTQSNNSNIILTKKINENTNNNILESIIDLDNYESTYIAQNIVIQPLNEIQNLSSSPITQSPQFIESNVFSNESNLEIYQNNNNCPYCNETLSNPLPLKVSEYLNNISIGKISANNIVEQYEFCRITNLKSELLKIIKEQKYSEYHVNAIKKIQEIELSKVNNPLIQINYFESLQPGYYGPKGLVIILKILTELFIRIGILTVDLYILQPSSQYLFQVFVFKTAIRLIVEDYKGISLNNAKEIMVDSVDFGLYIHNDNCKN
ncbi:3909_t:CDS:2, partial [Funneliformis mosseae]